MAIAFIPVRGGSKSIPLKNIKLFCGQPLVYWTAKAMQESGEVTHIVIATDSPEIKRTVQSFGFSKLSVYDRDPLNAEDKSSTESVMLEYLEKSNHGEDELFILVQATNPFIEATQINEAIFQLKSEGSDSLLSCVRFKRFFWNDDGTPVNYDYRNRPRRQDFSGVLLENGAFYISPVNKIIHSRNRLSGKISVYEMPEYTSFEIDEPDDWIIMEKLFKKHLQQAPTGKQIKLFISDVDGVMTDAGMYYSESGDELKKFNTHDGMAFQLLREAGVKTAIITTENTEIVTRRAKKLKVDHLFQGSGFKNKANALAEICEKEAIDPSEVAYIGDDINCLSIFREVGIKACPANATRKVMELDGIIKLTKAGGQGAVREFVEWLNDNHYISIEENRQQPSINNNTACAKS